MAFIRAILLLLSISCPAQALAVSKDDEAAQDAALQWLQLIDAGRYEEAASRTSQEVRTLENWLDFFLTQRALLGRSNKRQVDEVKHASTVPGVPEIRRYHVVRFKTSFEHRPAAIEEVTITKVGCCWEIFGYEISK